MDAQNQALKKMPRFKTKKEEREFWQKHDISEYMKAQINEKGYNFFKFENKQKPLLFRSKHDLMSATMYGENEQILNDDKYTEVIQIRIGKRDIAELKAIAKHDGRSLSSLLRLWILEHKREYLFQNPYIPEPDL